MLASSAICIRPLPITITQINPRNSSQKVLIQRQRLEFICGKSVSSLNRKGLLKGMASGSVRTRVSTDEEGVAPFEQEALIEESTSSSVGGLEATLNSLSKWLVSATFALVVLWRHDAEALWAAMGSVLNAGLSTTLKRILNQERPVSNLRSDPGMPSSHAQSIFYIVTFAILSVVKWFGLNEYTATLCMFILSVGIYFSWLRVSQKLHTTNQVVVGALLGSVYSFLWVWLWNAFLLDAFVSSLLVRIMVVLSAAAICLAFFVYVIRYWVLDEQ